MQAIQRERGQVVSPPSWKLSLSTLGASVRGAGAERVTFHRQLFSVKLKGNCRLEGQANNSTDGLM